MGAPTIRLEYTLLWIPLFPLLGAVFNLLFGGLIARTFGARIGKESAHLVAIAAVAFSCFLTFSLVMQPGQGLGFLHLLQTGEIRELIPGPGRSGHRIVEQISPWIISGETIVYVELMLDHLSGLMCMIITGVGLLIHVFSVGYMAKDDGYHRYFAYLNLFMASMLILVLAKSLVLTFVGWEGVGLCSYLLIGFWFTDEAKATAGRKAFITNRIGDFGVIVGMLILYAVVNSLDYDAIRSACATAANSPLLAEETAVFGVSAATAATLFLFLGCTGKSAQLPLYVWLPDAMAGPTPVSALIHAATMVTAGVYLIVRLNFLFALAPLTMAIIALVGGVTALFAALIAVTQTDIKKVLAYSTVSQLGYMFLAVGMGAWVSAIFHVMTHAFFKACLFLGAGAVIEACHHNQDVRTMGGLGAKMPVTRATFLISCLAIAGVPAFSGFFSKDEILLHAYAYASAWSPGLNYAGYALGLVAAAVTALYMFRLYFLTFEGSWRGDAQTWEKHVKEHGILSLPLLVLAVAATFAGFLGYPHALPGHQKLPHLLNRWFEPVVEISHAFTGEFAIGLRQRLDGSSEWFADASGHIRADAELTFMAISVGVAGLGIVLAWRLYRHGPSEAAAAWAARFGPLHGLSKNGFYVDQLYEALVLRPASWLAMLLHRVVDEVVIGMAAVGGVSTTVRASGAVARTWHNGSVRRYLVVLVGGVVLVLGMVYFNPRISKFGPNALNPTDVGGLRPQPGGVKLDWSSYGFGAPEQPEAPTPSPAGRAPVVDPVLAPRLAPDGTPMPNGGGR
ncbi:MAG: NADH-quinone oxidoreductase subunit L [Myxococcota bacterium]